jgi:hypothetical protein
MLETLSAEDERALLQMTTHPSNGALHQLINDHRDESEKSHKRVREDINGIGRKVDGFQVVQTDVLLRLQKLELTPPSVDKVSWTTKQLTAIVGSIVTGCLILGGGIWGLRSDISDVKLSIANAATLQNQRNESQEKQLTDVKAELQLRRIEIQNLSNKLSDFMLQKGK